MNAPKLSKLLSIVGPTGSGKTKLAVKLAEEYCCDDKKVSVISLDSRQIYADLAILSGADTTDWYLLRQNFPDNLRLFYLADQPLQVEWSLGALLKDLGNQQFFSQEVVILLGGNGLYHQRLVQNNQFATIPPNHNLRLVATSMNTSELAAWLKRVDSHKFAQLNHSDQANKRRLQRHLEISLYQKIYPPIIQKSLFAPIKQEFIMPSYNQETLEQKIYQRIENRFTQALQEVIQVKCKYPQLVTEKNFCSRMPLGFAQLLALAQNQISRQECLLTWKQKEWQYAKKQFTYLKKLQQLYELKIIPT